jgi:lipoprotein-releasing system permease protein
MAFELFVARRYLRAKRRISLISVIAGISIGGIMIGVAALVAVLSVFNGFNTLVRDLLVGFDPHLRVTPVVAKTLDPDEVLPLALALEQVTAAAPFIAGRSVVLYPQMRVLQVRGMTQSDVGTAVGLADKMVAGQFLDGTPRNPHPIVLGSLLSNALRASIGDTISLLSQAGLEEALVQMAEPRVIPCVVSGIFDAGGGQKEYNELLAFTDMATAREVFALDSGATGVELRLADLRLAPQVQAELQSRLGPDFRVESWQDLHADLFAVMELERWAAFVILSLIILVAVFNVLGSLTMTVIEKQRDIAIMKIMGASDGSIQRIFMLEGGMIGLIGTSGGLLLGIGLVILQRETGIFMQLDVTKYIISSLPVELRLADVLLVGTTALVLAFGAALYPARRAARLLAADAIRWE